MPGAPRLDAYVLHSLDLYFSEAPAWMKMALVQLSAASSLTDELAAFLIEDAIPASIDRQSVVNAIQACPFVVARNSEWHILRDVRQVLLLELATNRNLWASQNQKILRFAASKKRADAGRTAPSYLFRYAGRAYHLATDDPKEALNIYKEAEKEGASWSWLAGILAEEQQRFGLLPQDAIEPLFLRGLSLYREKSFAMAERYLARVSASDAIREEVPNALSLLALIHFSNKRHREGILLLDRAVQLFEILHIRYGQILSLKRRASAREFLDDRVGALDDLDLAIDLASRFDERRLLPWLLFDRADIRFKSRGLNAARADLDNALAISATIKGGSAAEVKIRQLRAKVQREAFELDGALRDIDRAAAVLEQCGVGRDLSYVKRDRGLILRDMGQIDLAVKEFEAAVATMVRLEEWTIVAELLGELARIRKDAGDLAGSARDLVGAIDAVIKSARDDRDKRIGYLGNSLYELNKWRAIVDKAETEERKRDELSKMRYETARSLALRDPERRDVVRSIWLFDEAIRSTRERDLLAKLYYGLGRAYFFLRKPEEAIRYLLLAKEFGAEASPLYASLAYCMLNTGRSLAETEPYFKKAIGLAPNNVYARSWYALALATEGRVSDAISEARGSVEQAKEIATRAGRMFDAPGLTMNLARVLTASGDSVLFEEGKELIESLRRRRFEPAEEYGATVLQFQSAPVPKQ